MPRRAEVYRLRARMGFGGAPDGDLVVIVQANALNTTWSTVLVVPLGVGLQGDDENPTLIPVSRRETGERAEYFAHVTQLRVVPVDELAPGAIGRLSAKTLERLDDVLARVLDL